MIYGKTSFPNKKTTLLGMTGSVQNSLWPIWY